MKAEFSYRLLVIAFALLICQGLYAQKTTGKEEVKVEKVSFLDRWAFKTNLLEWVVTLPNIGVGFDLGSSIYDKSAIFLSAKYNWHTYHEIQPYYNFDAFDVKAEYRKYNLPWMVGKNAESKWLGYMGGYLDYCTYNLKPSEDGINGLGVGAGLCMGWERPIYEYAKGALDLELGFTLGLQVSDYEVYRRASGGGYYSVDNKPWHLTPFPVISDLRVALVWRHKSIRAKYRENDPVLEYKEQVIADMKVIFDQTSKSDFDANLDKKQKALYASDDSLYRVAFISYVDGELSKRGYTIEGFASDKNLSGRPEVQKRLFSYADKWKKSVIADFDKQIADAQKKKALEAKKNAKKEEEANE